MRIGTAAPTNAELRAVPHHLIGCVEPDAPWTLVDFLRTARAALDDTWARDRLPVLVGGTGQYVWALLEGWQVPAVPPNPALRSELKALAAREDGEAVHQRLRELDPASAGRIDHRNLRRVIRAIEIVSATGEPIRPLHREAPKWSWSAIGLDWSREDLYRRADKRAAAMYRDGLVDETRGLIERFGPTIEPLRSMGYAEAARVVAGDWDVPSALERTRFETHRLIRMQATWFRRDDPRIEWRPGSARSEVVAAVESAATTNVR